MPIDTVLTVNITAEVSAQVLPNASNTVHIATTTPETIGFIQTIIQWVIAFF